jgi:hypothetical protein
MRRKIAIAALIALAVGPALAQTPPVGAPTRISGTVDKLDGQNLMVKSRDGQTLAIELAANVTIIILFKKSVADIKAGDYVASTGVKGPTARYMRSKSVSSQRPRAAPMKANTREI